MRTLQNVVRSMLTRPKPGQRQRLLAGRRRAQRRKPTKARLKQQVRVNPMVAKIMTARPAAVWMN